MILCITNNISIIFVSFILLNKYALKQSLFRPSPQSNIYCTPIKNVTLVRQHMILRGFVCMLSREIKYNIILITEYISQMKMTSLMRQTKKESRHLLWDGGSTILILYINKIKKTNYIMLPPSWSKRDVFILAQQFR